LFLSPNAVASEVCGKEVAYAASEVAGHDCRTLLCEAWAGTEPPGSVHARWRLREIKASAAELVEVGDLLFSRGEPSDPALVPRYQLYTRVKAALAMPMSPARIVALQAAKIGDRKKH
jgi:hypothetical protein